MKNNLFKLILNIVIITCFPITKNKRARPSLPPPATDACRCQLVQLQFLLQSTVETARWDSTITLPT